MSYTNTTYMEIRMHVQHTHIKLFIAITDKHLSQTCVCSTFDPLESIEYKQTCTLA